MLLCSLKLLRMKCEKLIQFDARSYDNLVHECQSPDSLSNGTGEKMYIVN